MLKTRVIPTLLYKDDSLVKGVAFDSWRTIGSAMQAVKVYNMRGVDELVFLDVAASAEGRVVDFSLIDEIADECFMPLTVGGGVRSTNNVRELLKVGADKVSINTAAVLNPKLISEAAKVFGSQCVVVSIDSKKHTSGDYEVFIKAGKAPTGINPVDLAKKAESLGAGEILLTSIERDGTMQGYDLELIKKVTEAVSIPVIASGGAGSYEDMEKAIKHSGASAVAASSIFQFTHSTPLEAKTYLKSKNINVRI